MDALSDVIAVTRTGRSRSAHVRWHAPWRQRLASVPGSAGFQVVLEGSCWLLAAGCCLRMRSPSSWARATWYSSLRRWAHPGRRP
ncbi:cupin domain-containing protein [Streptomyces bobili]|uniref:cupin domain-containing protein n=1 Tax=Streptomyces bobili TaxID=67280 RepID=UPI003658AFE7